MKQQIEIERKWLISNEIPIEIENLIVDNNRTVMIHQFYLNDNERFRVIIDCNEEDPTTSNKSIFSVEYIRKTKDLSKIGVSNVNIEENIPTLYGYNVNTLTNEEMYDILNTFVKQEYKSVVKARTILDNNFVFDVIYTPQDENNDVLYILEQEYDTIEDSEKTPEFPEHLKNFVVREVTNDSNYSNYNLASID